MDALMGIDLGSTSLKAFVYDLEGNRIAGGSRPTLKYHPNPDRPEWTVWQPEQIWGGTAEAIRDAVSQLSDPGLIKAVAVTGMGMDGVPIDKDGQWLYPFISWHDPRTAPQHSWWLENVGDEKTFLSGGWPIWTISTALRLLWMAEHEPEILKRTDKWLLIEDFLNFKLTGCQVTDFTMASCTGLFDQRRLNWSDEILGLAGIERRLLVDAACSGTVIGEVTETAAQATGLKVGTPIVLGGHDFLCGALPVGAFKPGVVLDVTGTWEIVLTATDEPNLTAEVFEAGLVSEAHVARGKFAGWGGAVAAEMLEWYRKEYGLGAKQAAETSGGDDWDYLMAEAAASPPGSRGVMFLPHLSGSGCPVKDGRSMGAFVGLTNMSGKGDMLRAVVEGLDYQFLDIVRSMQSGMGLKPDRLVAVGGAVRNKFWMQNKADVTGLPIDVPNVDEATPLGAAILAGIGVGLYRDEEDAFQHVYKQGHTFEPDLKLSEQYCEWFEIYRTLYPALKNVNHRLFERFRI
jgi:xylulokinase